MIKFDFFKGDNTPIVLALGFFDCLHLGHVKLFDETKTLAKTFNVLPCAFTFEDGLISEFKGSTGLVNTYEERIKKFEKLSIKSVISTVFTKEFADMLADDFVNILFTRFNVKAIVCGKDYKFGKGRLGNVDTLKDVCEKNGVILSVVSDVLVNGHKISTTVIKDLLFKGEIVKANELMTFPYEISGRVIKDRQVGRKLGFPTANVLIKKEKAPLKVGVYKTFSIIDGVKYNCITNYGSRPTFGLDGILTETYIDGFSGDLYGKFLTVYFSEYLRDCVRFESQEKLISQLRCDLEKIR